MVRLLLPLIGGVWTGVVVEAMQQWVVLSALIMLLALLAYWQKGRQPYGQRWWYGMALHLFLFGFGLLLANIQDERRLPRHFSGQGLSEQEVLLMGRIETIGPAGHKLKAKVKIQMVRDDNGHVHCASGSLLAYFDISAATRMLAAGDVALLIMVCGELPILVSQIDRFHELSRRCCGRNRDYSYPSALMNGSRTGMTGSSCFSYLRQRCLDCL